MNRRLRIAGVVAVILGLSVFVVLRWESPRIGRSEDRAPLDGVESTTAQNSEAKSGNAPVLSEGLAASPASGNHRGAPADSPALAREPAAKAALPATSASRRAEDAATTAVGLEGLPPAVTISKIIPSLLTTPEFSVNLPGKKSQPQRWLEMEVEFELADVEWADELTFKYTVQLDGKSYRGEVTHVNVRRGAGRYSVMYLAPRVMERALNGRELVPQMIENAWVTLEKDGRKLAEKGIIPRATPGVPPGLGGLVPRTETPFRVLWWDRYEDAKPTGASLPSLTKTGD
jgi:hypothetical protein